MGVEVGEEGEWAGEREGGAGEERLFRKIWQREEVKVENRVEREERERSGERGEGREQGRERREREIR